jgi:citrate lyase subunit beta/citryl-CoA lyase
MRKVLRSWLFVPGDNPAKMTKALLSGADVLIFDLEDSVALEAKAQARENVRMFLNDHHDAPQRPAFFVRVNALETPCIDADLDAVMSAHPEGIVLPKATCGKDVTHLSVKIAVREAENNLPDGSTRILAIATETAASVFGLGTYATSSARLMGLTWGVEDLSADVGSLIARDDEGHYTAPYTLVRSLTLFGAAAANVQAIDGIEADFSHTAALERACDQALRDGFTGKLAIHPAQVPIINQRLTPSDAMLKQARAIVDAFAAQPNAGVIALEGRMLDRPHLKRAQKWLELGQ